MSAPCGRKAGDAGEQRRIRRPENPAAGNLGSAEEIVIKSEGRRNHEKEIRQAALSVGEFKAGYHCDAYHYSASRSGKSDNGHCRTGSRLCSDADKSQDVEQQFQGDQ